MFLFLSIKNIPQCHGSVNHKQITYWLSLQNCHGPMISKWWLKMKALNLYFSSPQMVWNTGVGWGMCHYNDNLVIFGCGKSNIRSAPHMNNVHFKESIITWFKSSPNFQFQLSYIFNLASAPPWEKNGSCIQHDMPKYIIQKRTYLMSDPWSEGIVNRCNVSY